jgi:hypothetical protein
MLAPASCHVVAISDDDDVYLDKTRGVKKSILYM